MSPKKKLTFSEACDRYFRMFVIYMGKDMTLRNRVALFYGSTVGGILTWMLIPKAFHYAFYSVPIIAPMLQGAFPPAETTHKIAAYVVCAFLTYVLLKPFCRGLVVSHPNYFNEGNVR